MGFLGPENPDIVIVGESDFEIFVSSISWSFYLVVFIPDF